MPESNGKRRIDRIVAPGYAEGLDRHAFFARYRAMYPTLRRRYREDPSLAIS